MDQAITIQPFSVTNFYVNYTMKNASFLRGSKLNLSVNNLFDNHNLVGITPFTARHRGRTLRSRTRGLS